jgi:hypothetical protein
MYMHVKEVGVHVHACREVRCTYMYMPVGRWGGGGGEV